MFSSNNDDILTPPGTELVFNESIGSTMCTDQKPSCSLQQTTFRASSPLEPTPMKKVHFDITVHVKEITHRNDMTENELEEISSFDEYFPNSLFDTEEEESILQRLERRKQLKFACKIRQRFLSAIKICAFCGKDSAIAVQLYTDYSSVPAQEAHARGLKAAEQPRLDVEEAGAAFFRETLRKRPSLMIPSSASKRTRFA